MQNNSFHWEHLDKSFEEKISPHKQSENNWRKKYSVVFTVAFFFTCIQFFIFKSCVNSNQKLADTNKYAVIVANKNMNKGDFVNEENTKILYMDVSESKNNFILNSEFSNFSGSQLLVNSEKNTPILKNMITIPLQNKTLVEKIPPGKRFFVLDVDLGSLTDHIKTDDKVDIIAHMDIPDFGKATETILDRVTVVDIENGHSLGFYLSPEEIKILSFMKPYSEFSVAIRNPNDTVTKSEKPSHSTSSYKTKKSSTSSKMIHLKLLRERKENNHVMENYRKKIAETNSRAKWKYPFHWECH